MLKSLFAKERFVELLPEDIDELKKPAKVSSQDKKPEVSDNFFELIKGLLPSAQKDYLLTLSDFLATDVIVSEEKGYEAAETAVEVEFR